jgi:fibronectin-binding autotransporter adhesin
VGAVQRGKLRARLLATASLGVMLTGLGQASTAANFTVTNTNDTGAGSLRDAITNDNNAGGSNNINVQSGLIGQVTLGSSLPTVATSTAIDLSSGLSTSIFLGGSGGVAFNATSVSLSAPAANSYTGTTALQGGTLSVISAGYTANNSPLTMAPGTTLNVNAATSFASLSGNGTINLNSGLSFTGNNNTTFGGIISGVAPINGLTKQGTGTLTLTGANTYTGSTFVNGGTLALGPGGSIASSNQVSIGSGATLDISSGGNQTVQNLVNLTGGSVRLGGNTLTDNATNTFQFNGVISGTGGLTLQGSGILLLGNVQAYTGPTTVNGGTLALLANGSVAASSGVNLASFGTTFSITGTGTVTVKDLSGVAGSAISLGPANLAVGTANSTTFGGVISGLTPINGLTKQGSGTLTLTGANTYTGPTTISAGTLALGPGGSLASSNQFIIGTGATLDISSGGNQTVQNLANMAVGSIRLGANTLTDNATNFSSFDGVISGTGGLTLQSSGILQLSSVQAYTGPTTVNGGILALTANGSIAASSGINLASSRASFEISTAGTVTIKDLSGVAGASIDLGPASLTVGTANSTTFAGVIFGPASINGLTKQGSGTLTLTGANNYFGPTTINAGTLAIGAGGSIASSNVVTLSGSAALDISTGGNQRIASLTGGPITAVNLGANTLTVGNLLGVSNSTTFAGVITGTGGLTLQGSSALTLLGVTSYSGQTIINGGTLAIGAGGSIAASNQVSIGSLATLDISSGGNQTVQNLSGGLGSGIVKLGGNTLTDINTGSNSFKG